MMNLHYLKGGFVKNDTNTDELCICMNHYLDDISSNNWIMLHELRTQENNKAVIIYEELFY